MNKKNLVTAGLVVVGTLILTVAAGCSDDSTGSTSSGFSCPAVGSKACPNDEATTQAAADACKKCESQYKALVSCSGASTTPKCGADGKSETQTIDQNKCQNEQAEVVKCVLGSAGTPDGG